MISFDMGLRMESVCSSDKNQCLRCNFKTAFSREKGHLAIVASFGFLSLNIM